MPRAVHISAYVVVLLAAIAAAGEPGMTINIAPEVLKYAAENGLDVDIKHEVSSDEQCTGEDGLCLDTGDRCNVPFKIVHNYCTSVPDKQERFTKHNNFIWNDFQCPIMQSPGGAGDLSLLDCLTLCTNKSNCTAVNYAPPNDHNSVSDCILRACQFPVPKPEWFNPDYNGYSIRSVCPVGFFTSNGSTQCFKIYRDLVRPWLEAKEKCEEEGLMLAHPSDNTAIKLRKYIFDTYGDGEVWLGARADGSNAVWQNDGTTLSPNNRLDWPGHPNPVTTDWCLSLLVSQRDLREHPGRPYAMRHCTTPLYPQYTLCEVTK